MTYHLAAFYSHNSTCYPFRLRERLPDEDGRGRDGRIRTAEAGTAVAGVGRIRTALDEPPQQDGHGWDGRGRDETVADGAATYG